MFRITLAALLLSSSLVPAKEILHTFKKVQITDKFWAEGATFGDFNRDGKVDIAYGPFWYEGPDFKKSHEYYPATATFTLKKKDGVEEVIPGFEGGLGS